MIRLEYKGRLGNQIFQYSYARILAEETGYMLLADPIAGFPRTADAVPGLSLRTQHPFVIQKNQLPPLDRMIRDTPRCEIVVNAYLQQYSYYAPYLDRIRTWFEPAQYDTVPYVSGADTLVINLRLGDLIALNRILVPTYYTDLIKSIGCPNVRIVTDSPKSNYLDNFKEFNPEIIASDPLSDFKWLLNASKLVISQSTFGWWAGILSGTSEVWMPETSNSIWSTPVGKLRRHDLRVLDNPLWHVVETEAVQPGHPYVVDATL